MTEQKFKTETRITKEPKKLEKTTEVILAETKRINAQVALEEAKGLRDKPEVLKAKEEELNKREGEVTRREEAASELDKVLIAKDNNIKKTEQLMETAKAQIQGAEEQARQIIAQAEKRAQEVLKDSKSKFGEGLYDVMRIARIIHGSGDAIISPYQKRSLLHEIRILVGRFHIELTYDKDGNLLFMSGPTEIR